MGTTATKASWRTRPRVPGTQTTTPLRLLPPPGAFPEHPGRGRPPPQGQKKRSGEAGRGFCSRQRVPGGSPGRQRRPVPGEGADCPPGGREGGRKKTRSLRRRDGPKARPHRVKRPRAVTLPPLRRAALGCQGLRTRRHYL